jgi:hypothetical protein
MSINTNKSYKTRKEIRKKKRGNFFLKKGRCGGRWCGTHVGKKGERERERERERRLQHQDSEEEGEEEG